MFNFLKIIFYGIIWVFDYLNPGLVDLIILGHISKFKKALGMYKLPKVNLKWDNLYVYYLRSFKHLYGIFFINWFENRMIFALANLATLFKHASLNRRPVDNYITFFSSKQKSTFMIYGGLIRFFFFV